MAEGSFTSKIDADPSDCRPTSPRSFQGRVVDWMMETFSMEVCRNTTERNHRFLEEALELVQAMGCTAAEAHMLVDYTFGRPMGEQEQEVGGVMVTLAALCAAADISMAELGERELDRCWRNIECIRTKQAAKPRNSPLPGKLADETSARLPTAFGSMHRNLQSLCDRLNEVFDVTEEGDVPDELCREAREAIEELWQERDQSLTFQAKAEIWRDGYRKGLAEASPSQPTPCWCPYCREPHGVNRQTEDPWKRAQEKNHD